MCEVLNVKKIELYTNFDKPLCESETELIRHKLKELANHKPIQYVVNSTQFLEFELELNNNVLIPRPETEELVQNILNSNPNRDINFNILDIGTGSGCIAISLAGYFKNSKIFAIDTSADAVQTAQNNACKYNLDNIYIYNMDILRQIPKTKFDIIVSNPPYIPIYEYNHLDKNVLNYEPKLSLTDNNDGLTFYKRFSEIFPQMLTDKGKFYLETGYNQAESVKNLFDVTKFNLIVSKDTNGYLRFIEGTLRQ